ncbi:MAG: type II toxin-antitoxin system HicA family toxin [Candidatus Marinimicrobia bacterium]|nr:type II toxin-antitoxin system HicA family toxin [Candidatus Neomarinimicrobiota bacterium]
MSRKLKLLEKAWNNSKGLTFDELCRLAEYAGFVLKKQKGSHKTFKHPDIRNRLDSIITIQKGKNGEAKAYQVTRLLELIDKYTLM